MLCSFGTKPFRKGFGVYTYVLIAKEDEQMKISHVWPVLMNINPIFMSKFLIAQFV